MHVNLATFSRLGPEKVAKARLRVAGGVYELTAHTGASRKRFFGLDAPRRDRVSHFAARVSFSPIGVQSCG